MRASPYIHMIGMVTCPRIHILATVVAVVVAAAVLGGSHHPWGGQFRLHARHPHILWHPTAHDVGPTALAHMIWMCWRWAPCSSGHFVSEQAASQKSNLPGRPSVLWCTGRHEPTTACTALCASVDGPVVIGISSNRPCPSNQPPSSPSQPGFTPDNVFVCFCTGIGSLSCIDTRGRLLQPGDPVAYTGPQGRAVLVPTTPTPAPVSSLLASLQDVKGWSQPV